MREHLSTVCFDCENHLPPLDSPGTIPDIFDAIQNALSDDKKVEIEAYDDVLGFPSGEVKIDIDAFAYDGGRTSSSFRSPFLHKFQK